MRIKRPSIIALLSATLLVASATSALAADCLMQAFADLAARYGTLVQDVTTLVRNKVDKVMSPTGRWGQIAQADRQSYALLEIKQSLGSAEKAAADRLAAVGPQTAQSHVNLINDGVVGSRRTSLQEMGEGIGAAVAAAGVDDPTMASCLNGVRNAVSGTPTFAAHAYTSAEAGADLKTLLARQAADTDPPAIIRPAMWNSKLPNAESGAVAELAVGARLKRSGNTHIEIGADELPTLPGGAPNPLYQKRVDILTDTEIHQVGLRGTTIRDKILSDPDGTAAAIKAAMDAKPARHYYFSFVEDDWIPLQSTIDDLNARLAALYSPGLSPQTFARSDFRYITLDP